MHRDPVYTGLQRHIYHMITVHSTLIARTSSIRVICNPINSICDIRVPIFVSSVDYATRQGLGIRRVVRREAGLSADSSPGF